MNELQIFDNPEFGKIRAVEIDGEPWLVGKDVAKVLGYKNPQEAVRNHVEDEDKGVSEILTPGGKQMMAIINESGLYSLVFSSKLPTAKKFKRWVTSEVLPAIRQTGTYSLAITAPAVEQRALTTDDYLKAALIVSNCRNERLPYVLDLLEQGGFSIPTVEATQQPTYEVAKTINNAISEHGFTLVQLSRLTGLDRVQLGRYKMGSYQPRKERAAYIVHVILEAIAKKENRS